MAISSILGDAIVPTSYGFRNVIINGNFSINQRAYTSGSNLASGAYGFDRWKSNYTNTTLTFTSAPQGQTVTISTLGVIRQIVERANVQPGSYVLSWTGTAVGRVYSEGSTAPSYSAGPLSAYLDGTANVIVEFTPPAAGSATLGKVQLELGSRATQFEHRPISAELELCQRYYWRFTDGGLYSTAGVGISQGTTSGIVWIPFPTTMRANPTSVEFSGMRMSDGVSGGAAILSMSLDYATPTRTQIYLTFGSFSTAYRMLFLQKDNNPAHYVAFGAEL